MKELQPEGITIRKLQSMKCGAELIVRHLQLVPDINSFSRLALGLWPTVRCCHYCMGGKTYPYLSCKMFTDFHMISVSDPLFALEMFFFSWSLFSHCESQTFSLPFPISPGSWINYLLWSHCSSAFSFLLFVFRVMPQSFIGDSLSCFWNGMIVKTIFCWPKGAVCGG